MELCQKFGRGVGLVLFVMAHILGGDLVAAPKRGMNTIQKPTIRECLQLQKRVLREVPRITQLCESVHGRDRCVVVRNGIQSYVQDVQTFSRRERCPTCTVEPDSIFLPYPLNEAKSSAKLVVLADRCTDEYGM